MAKPTSKPADDSAAVTETAAVTASPETSAADSAAAKARRDAFLKRVKVTKNVTLPLFKWAAGVSKFLKIEGAIFQGKEIKEGAGGAAKKEPAHLMNVTDMETGEMGQVIVATVLKGILTEDYPDNAYVGKTFEIKQRKIPGKNYNGFDVAEIEID